MAYRKRSYRPKRYGGFQKGYKQLKMIRKLNGQAPLTWAEKLSLSAGPIGKLASNVAQIAGLVNSETKFKDTTLAAVAISNTGGDYSNLNDIAQGDDYNARNGRSILDKNLIYKLRFLADSADVSSCVSWAIILKKSDETLSATPWTQVFSSATPTALVNKDTSTDFIVLRRGTYVFGNTAGTNQRFIEGMINLKGIHTKYDGTAATNFENGQIFIVFISDQASTYPSVYGTLRFNYYDN